MITGTGKVGAEVVVRLGDGNIEIGRAIVGADGSWTVDASNSTLKAGELISATQTYEGVTSDKSTVIV